MIKETLCEHCVFKTMVMGEQTGCHLNRLDKLPHHQHGLYQIVDTYCSTCRNIYWEMSQGIKTLDELATAVMLEVKLQYDVLIVCDEGDTEDKIRTTLDAAQAKTYKPSQVVVAFKYSKENEVLLKRLAPTYPKNYSFMMSTETELSLRLKPVMAKSRAPYVLFINPGDDYDEAIMYEFDRSLNVELKPKILYASAKFYVCPKILYEKFMYEEHPFARINEYVQSIATASKRADS